MSGWWNKTQERELGGQRWLLRWVWDRVQKKMVWEVMRWVWATKSGGGATAGWTYWGTFGTLGEWKTAVKQADW